MEESNLILSNLKFKIWMVVEIMELRLNKTPIFSPGKAMYKRHYRI